MLGGVLSSCRWRPSNVLLLELELCRAPPNESWDPFLRRSSGVKDLDSGVFDLCFRKLLVELWESFRSGVRDLWRCILNGDTLTLLVPILGNLWLPADRKSFNPPSSLSSSSLERSVKKKTSIRLNTFGPSELAND